jgi:hypothetical protein
MANGALIGAIAMTELGIELPLANDELREKEVMMRDGSPAVVAAVHEPQEREDERSSSQP